MFCISDSHLKASSEFEKDISIRVNIGRKTNMMYMKNRVEYLNILIAYMNIAFSFQLSEITFDNKTLFAETVILIKYLTQ